MYVSVKKASNGYIVESLMHQDTSVHHHMNDAVEAVRKILAKDIVDTKTSDDNNDGEVDD